MFPIFRPRRIENRQKRAQELEEKEVRQRNRKRAGVGRRRIMEYIANGCVGDLDLTNTDVTDDDLPADLKVNGNFIAWHAERLTTLKNIQVSGGYDITGTRIANLPDSLKHVNGYFKMLGTRIDRLPNNFHVAGELNLMQSNFLSELPSGLVVDGDLDISSCRRIRRLPPDLIVRGKLDVRNTVLARYSQEELRKMAPGINEVCNALDDDDQDWV